MDYSQLFNEKDVIYTYTSQQAEEDGILIKLATFYSPWDKSLFNYATRNLLSKGYMEEIKDKLAFNVPNILDLMVQATGIVGKQSKDFTVPDHFFSGTIELPSGCKQQIFICQNETGRFTLMLPEDY